LLGPLTRRPTNRTCRCARVCGSTRALGEGEAHARYTLWHNAIGVGQACNFSSLLIALCSPLQAALDQKASIEALEQRASKAQVRILLCPSLLTSSGLLCPLSSSPQVIQALKRKMNRADAEELLARKADITEVNRVLALKADADRVAAELDRRAERSEVSAQMPPSILPRALRTPVLFCILGGRLGRSLPLLPIGAKTVLVHFTQKPSQPHFSSEFFRFSVPVSSSSPTSILPSPSPPPSPPKPPG